MLPSFCNQEITRVRPGTKEERGSTIPDWDPTKVDEKKIAGCSIQPAATSTTYDGRVLGISEQLTAYLPEGADVQAGDRIVFDGATYAINGEPKTWTAAGNLHNIQLTLSRWEG